MNNDAKNRNIALLATGDEIINGDILNSNAKEIAQQLFNEKMLVGMHMVAGDNIEDIEAAIRFLLGSHAALIITGGLGPTSDDLTRYALSRALNKELIFDAEIWESIVNRLKSIGYHNFPESNRQQAFFPEGSSIIQNPNGTAAGCIIEHGQQRIFMLPGPPFECFPMLADMVIPTLKKLHFPQNVYFQKWLLFSVSEGEIAEKLDALTHAYDCETGYRICYPYVECKLFSKNLDDFKILVPKITEVVKPYIFEDGSKTASEILREKLKTLPLPLKITDYATGGILESTLKTPDTFSHIQFVHEPHSEIEIRGLEEFWQNKNANETSLEFIFKKNNHIEQFKKTIPYRGSRVKQYAIEFISKEILQYLLK